MFNVTVRALNDILSTEKCGAALMYISLQLAATYFLVVATFAALAGQHVVRKLIAMLGRASIIVFILATTIFISAISLGTYAPSIPPAPLFWEL